VGTDKLYLSSNPRCEKHWSGSGYRQSVPILQTQQHVTVNSEQVGTDEVYLSSNPRCRRHWSGSGYKRNVPILQSQLGETLEWIWVQAECTDPPIPVGWDIGVDLGTSRVYLSSNHSYTLLQSGYQGTSKVYLLPSLRWVSHWSK
jgi:hypothetical protein